MKAWIKRHHKATIWIAAAIAVGAVYMLKSRLSAATSTADLGGGSATTGTVAGTDPTSDYATGYDSGYTAGLGSGGVTTPVTVGGGTSGSGSGGGKGGTVKGAGATTTARLDQILKDLAKPGLTAARRLQLQTTYHQITGKTYTATRNPYKAKPKQPRRPSGRPSKGAGSGTVAR